MIVRGISAFASNEVLLGAVFPRSWSAWIASRNAAASWLAEAPSSTSPAVS